MCTNSTAARDQNVSCGYLGSQHDYNGITQSRKTAVVTKIISMLKYTAVNTIPTKMRCAVNTGSVVGKSSSARPE